VSWTWEIVKGDMVRLPFNNGYERVTGGDKLKQDCEMVLTTKVRANGLGTSLDDTIGTSVDGEPTKGNGMPALFQFQTKLRNGLSRYRYLQRNFQFNRRTPSELLDDFSPVQIWQDGSDPRSFRWKVDLFTLGKLPNFSLGGTTN